MKYGDRVRVRKEPNIEFNITFQQFGSFGRETPLRLPSGRVTPLVVWYEAHELEVIE